MTRKRKNQFHPQNAGSFSRRKRIIVEQKASLQRVFVTRLNRLILLLTSILGLMIAVRVMLLMMEANPQNTFANFIYGSTQPFLNLFDGLIQSVTLSGDAVLELSSLVAIFMYFIAAWVLTTLLEILFTDAGKRRVTTLRYE